jgi:uncharacterized membrane protein
MTRHLVVITVHIDIIFQTLQIESRRHVIVSHEKIQASHVANQSRKISSSFLFPHGRLSLSVPGFT